MPRALKRAAIVVMGILSCTWVGQMLMRLGRLLGSPQCPCQGLRSLQGEARPPQGAPTVAAGIRFALRARGPIRPGVLGLDANLHHLKPLRPTGLVRLAKDGDIALTLDLGVGKSLIPTTSPDS